MGDNDSVNQPGCCDGDQCCSPGSTGDKRGLRRWMPLIFTTVVLLACAVAAYSLFWRGNGAATSCCPPGSAAAVACGQAATNPNFDHASAVVGLSVIVLTNSDQGLSSERLAVISDVRASLESQNSQLKFETIGPADSSFSKLVGQYGIAVFPTVIVTGQDKVLLLSENLLSADTILTVFKPTSASAVTDSASPSKSL